MPRVVKKSKVSIIDIAEHNKRKMNIKLETNPRRSDVKRIAPPKLECGKSTKQVKRN